jgi:tetratricopeptide (TPR) repeat protein
MYNDVLAIEESNRDALLGLGAIAVIEKNHVKAREVYLSLLDLDPRDPIATAALAGLHSSKESLEIDKDYLISMLDKNPGTPHLNFALGNVYAQLDQWTEAQKYYFSAWQQDGDNADYLFNLAVSMDQLSKAQQAIDFYKDSLVKAVNKQVSFSREAVKKRIDELTRL